MSSLVVTEERRQAVDEAFGRLEDFATTGQAKFLAFSPISATHVVTRKLRSLWRPFSETYYAPGLRDALASELRGGYDVLHLEQLWSGWAGLHQARSLLNIHHFEIIDREGGGSRPLGERKALWQMRRATSRILRGNTAIRVFTPRLLERAQTINASAKYWVLPFALDLSLYPMQPFVDEPVVGLVGSMHWLPTRSAGERLLTRIWPRVKRHAPRAKLYIAGWNAQRYLGHLLPLPDVVLEENLRHPTEFFSRAAVMVYAPSRGSGMKVKVLESMAYGVPVVTTWEGVEGIDYGNGVHCWVDEGDEAIATRVVQLLDDAKERQRLREAARALMEERYAARPVVDRMVAIYDEVAKR